MAKIKITPGDYISVMTDMKNNIGSSRTDEYYFQRHEISEQEIRQASWDNDIIVNLIYVNEVISSFTYQDILN